MMVYNKLTSAVLAMAVALGMAATARAKDVEVLDHWSFDVLEAGNVFADSGRNALPATLRDPGSVQLTEGKFGKAIALDGTPNSFLQIQPITNIQKSNFTFAAWVYLKSPGPNVIFSDWQTEANSGFMFGVLDKADPVAQLQGERNPGRGASAGRMSMIRLPANANQPLASVPLNEWHHMMWIWSRDDKEPTPTARYAGVLTYYLDGARVASENKNTTNFAPTADMVSNNVPMRIGSRETPLNARTPGPVNFTGFIDEIWIFDDVLTPIERGNLVSFNDIMGKRPPVRVVETPVTPVPATPPPVVISTPAPKVVSSVSRHSRTPLEVMGIVFGLTMVVAMASYLIWAVTERRKIRTQGA